MPLLKKKLPKKPNYLLSIWSNTAKKTSGKEEILSIKRMVRVFSITLYSFISYRVGFSTLYTCIHPSQPPPTPLRFIVHGIFFIKSIIYQVGRSTCNITFNSQGVLSKKKKYTIIQKKVHAFQILHFI